MYYVSFYFESIVYHIDTVLVRRRSCKFYIQRSTDRFLANQYTMNPPIPTAATAPRIMYVDEILVGSLTVKCFELAAPLYSESPVQDAVTLQNPSISTISESR